MQKEIDLLLTRSIVEGNLYDVSSLNCIYLYSIFSNYCEVEVLDFKDYRHDLDRWEAVFKTSYTFSERDLTVMFPTSSKLGVSVNLVLSNKDRKIPARFLTKKELLRESLFIKGNGYPTEKSERYWIRNKLGLVACSYGMTAGVMLAFIPQMSVIDLLNLKTSYIYS